MFRNNMFWLFIVLCSLPMWSCQDALDASAPEYIRIRPDPRERYMLASFVKLNWFQAAQTCHRYGMNLATVNSYDQHLQVIRSIALNGHLLGKEDFWLGASNLGNKESWTWIDSGAPLGYKLWAAEEPAADLIGVEACLRMGKDDFWYSEECQSEHFFICERTCDNRTSFEPIYL